MRIEILVGNSEEPLIFPLNKPKLTLGSGETCDIIVDAPNISRKHVQIVSEGDNFFVIDQGSTNGTFINEERLVPGRRTEFTSFFPVRLGDEVLITLLSDEEATEEAPSLSFPETPKPSARGGDESTKMISLGDLRKAKTSDLVVRRSEIAKKKTAAAGKTDKKVVKKSKRAADKSRMRSIQIVVFLFLGGAAYVNFFVLEKSEDNIAQMGEVVETNRPVKVEEPVIVPPPSLLIPQEELTPKERLMNLFADIKCTLDTEKYFCNTIPKANEGQYGAVQIGAMMNVILDGELYFEEARKVFPLPPAAGVDGQHTPEELSQYQVSLSEVAGAIFLLRAIPATIDYAIIKDFKMTYALFIKDPEGNSKPGVAIAVTSEGLKKFKTVFEEVHLVNIGKIGPSAIGFIKPMVHFY